MRELVDQILADGDAENAVISELATKFGVTQGAIQTFLSSLGEANVETDQLPQKLTEIAEQHIVLRSRLAALVTDDPAIRVLIDQAQFEVGQGEYEQADSLLTQAENADLVAARQADELESKAREAKNRRYLNAAATRARRGDISLTQLRYLDASGHFREAAELVPEGVDRVRASYFSQQGRALDLGAKTLAAIAAYERATVLDADATWSWIYLGRLYFRAGDLARSEDAFLEARTTAEITEHERDLSVADNEIGDVRVAQGNLPGALDAFQASLDIREKLAARDPGNSGWERDLSVSHEKVGEVRVAQGNLVGALEAFQASHDIAEKLAARDPGNAEWQRDLIVSHWKLADLTEQLDEPVQTRRHLELALAIAKDLERNRRFAPKDAFVPGAIEQRLAPLIQPAAGE